MKKIYIGIIGGAGYTAGELLRVLLNHPNASISFVHSQSQAGKPLWAIHTDLIGDTELVFTHKISTDVDVLFLCMGHGESKRFLAENMLPSSLKVIDLSQDFRSETDGFVYGLPELQRSKIKNANRIANPGCFATAIELALLPLAKADLLQNDIHISAITGSTGAGQSLNSTSHFSWRNNNVSIYKAFTHQHLREINMSLQVLQGDFSKKINFIPYRGNFSRGILANIYTIVDGSIADAMALYQSYYITHPFTHLSQTAIDVKQVVNTNKCLIALEKYEGQLLISSVIDNLIKGASGQAIQNMNLMFGLEETAGLKLKSIGF